MACPETPPTQELSALILEETQEESPRAPTRVLIPRSAVLVVGAVLGVALLAVGRPSATKFLAQRHAEGGEVVLASSNKNFPYGFIEREECGVDFKILNVVHNNFGGQGPGTGEEGIIFNCSETNHGKYVRNVLVKVNARSPYASKSAHFNGKHGDFGDLRVDSGKKVDVRFSIWDMQGKPFNADQFRITFYDLDEGPYHSSREFVIVDDMHPETDRDKHTQVENTRANGHTEFIASQRGSGADNPHDSKKLTPLQQDRSVVFEYEDVHYFDLTLGSTTGHSPRSFAFALHSALACHDKKYPITTTVTSTSTTTTSTTHGQAPPPVVPASAGAGVAAAGAGGAAYMLMGGGAGGLPAGYPVGAS